MPDLSALLGQMQHLMTPYDGAVNWTLAKDIARRSAAEKPDPTPSRTDRDRVADSVRLADHWLDTVTHSRPASPSAPRGAERSGSSRPWTSGRCWSSRSPPTSPTP